MPQKTQGKIRVKNNQSMTKHEQEANAMQAVARIADRRTAPPDYLVVISDCC